MRAWTRQRSGYTLLELMIVLGLILVVLGMATPFFLQWRDGLNSGRGARMAYDALRQARSRALNSNFQHMVSFDPAGGRLQVVKGDRGYNTPAAGWDVDHPVLKWQEVGNGVAMKSGAAGDSNASVNVQFNADGTARLETPAGAGVAPPDSTVTVCFQGGPDGRRSSIVISTCGRITLQ